jgi:hypothetical protein
VSPLRRAFASANARFHLAGFYALAHLLRQFVALQNVGDPAIFPLALAALLVFQGTTAGLFGMAFEAAAGGTAAGRSFPRHAALLFLPLLWLTFKIDLCAMGAALAAAAGTQIATGQPYQKSLELTLFWSSPALGLLTQVLALYSRPLCILSRLRGERRAHLREGWRLLRANPGLSGRVLGLLLLTTAAGAGLHYAAGPGAVAEPGVPEALILFLDCYFEMVGFFVAARVILERPAPGEPPPLAVPGPSA